MFSDVDGWDGSSEPNGITQNYDEDEERYLYTVTVNIWAEENGRKPAAGTTPYMTLTSTKEN